MNATIKRAALMALAALILTGCATTATPAEQEDDPLHHGTSVERVTLPDGRTVTCVAFRWDRGAGFDCDWRSAR